jgi:hypothetical protein
MQMRGRLISTKFQEYKRMLKEDKDYKPPENMIDDPLLGKLSKEGTIKIIEADLPRTFPTLRKKLLKITFIIFKNINSNIQYT